ncbi:hypothetical protein ACFSR7_36215 [Cohnella sp. GCM10020058]|uniref:hypothetical protein n=1 Tax=Cohnella sp. GCM10020058 TaxID=3317330 RepID=UPI0036430B56
MAKKFYHVTNEFVDRETGETILPGDFIEADDKRAAILVAADVIGDEATKAELDAAKKAAEADKEE